MNDWMDEWMIEDLYNALIFFSGGCIMRCFAKLLLSVCLREGAFA